jgi:hypothetical protein
MSETRLNGKSARIPLRACPLTSKGGFKPGKSEIYVFSTFEERVWIGDGKHLFSVIAPKEPVEAKNRDLERNPIILYRPHIHKI